MTAAKPGGQNGPRERPRRGPRGAQESPRRGPGAPRGPGQRGKDKRRQEQTRPAAGRDNKLTKGLFRSTKAVSTSPVANLLLVHLMHGSTLVYTMKAYGGSGGSEVRATPPGPETRPGPPRKHPGPLRTAQEPPKSHPRPLRTAQESAKRAQPPGAAKEVPRRDPGGLKRLKTIEKQLFL